MAGKQTLVASASLALLFAASPARADDEREKSDEADRKGRFEIGAGFDTDEQFVVKAGVYNDNLFGSGFGLATVTRLSARRQLFLLRFTDANVLDSKLSLTADLYNDTRNWTGFTRKGVGGALTLSAPLGPHTRGFVGYRIEDVSLELDGEPRPLPQFGDALYRDGLISAVRAGFVHDTRDNPIFPRSGGTVGGYVEISDRAIGSDLELGRAHAFASRHGRLVGLLSLHTRLGVDGVWSRGGGPVPLTERLQLEGHRDIRGYGIGSVSPLGGNLKLASQTELELTLSKRLGLSAVAFFDAGGVWDFDGQSCQVALSASSPVDPCAGPGPSLLSNLRESVGFGLVWMSPIGPMRFDWAFPLDRRPGQSSVDFLFSIGGVF